MMRHSKVVLHKPQPASMPTTLRNADVTRTASRRFSWPQSRSSRRSCLWKTCGANKGQADAAQCEGPAVNCVVLPIKGLHGGEEHLSISSSKWRTSSLTWPAKWARASALQSVSIHADRGREHCQCRGRGSAPASGAVYLPEGICRTTRAHLPGHVDCDRLRRPDHAFVGRGAAGERVGDQKPCFACAGDAESQTAGLLPYRDGERPGQRLLQHFAVRVWCKVPIDGVERR
jgi:hypothetical protein